MTKAKPTSDSPKTCFIICPIGPDDSLIRRKSIGLIDATLKPFLSTYFERVVSPFDISTPGSITLQVVELLLSADLVIANLTNLNPNVMYELAVRHAARKPVIILAEGGTVLPFDILQERTLFYSDDQLGVIELKTKLTAALESALDDTFIDNPIFRVADKDLVSENSKTNDFQTSILNRLDNIEKSLSTGSSYGQQPLLSKLDSYAETIALFFKANIDPNKIKLDHLRQMMKVKFPAMYFTLENRMGYIELSAIVGGRQRPELIGFLKDRGLLDESHPEYT